MNDEDKIIDLESFRDEVIAFLDSRIYREYIKGTQSAIAQAKDDLCSTIIIDNETLYFQVATKAKLDLLTNNLSDFEDMVSNLNGRIEAILRSVQPNETQLNDNEEI